MALNWQAWRENYDRTPFAAQQGWHDGIAATYPEQAHWTLPAAKAAMGGSVTVTEIGGWRGELADTLIPEYGIERWINYDICPWAIDHSRCHHARYHPVLLNDWPWNISLVPADVLVMTHVVEHMRYSEFLRLSEQFDRFDRILVEAPVLADIEGYDWEGFEGTHLLEVGWAQLEVAMAERGWGVPRRFTGTETAPDGSIPDVRIWG